MQKRNKDFAMFPHWVVDEKIIAQLSLKAKVVYFCICRHANFNTKVTTVSNRILAEESGINLHRIVEARTELKKHGLIKTWKRKWNGSMGTLVIFTSPKEQRNMASKIDTMGKDVENRHQGESVENRHPYLNDSNGKACRKSTYPMSKIDIPYVENRHPEIETLLDTRKREEDFATQQGEEKQPESYEVRPNLLDVWAAESRTEERHQPKVEKPPPKPTPLDALKLKPILPQNNPIQNEPQKDLAEISDDEIKAIYQTLKTKSELINFFIKNGYAPNSIAKRLLNLEII